MYKTIITRASNKRICKIFKSNSQIEFNFFSYYEYKELQLNKNFITNIHNGYFNWIIFTSYRSWEFLNKQIKDNGMNIPKRTKIAVFGLSSSFRVIEYGGRVDFMEKSKNASEFSTKLLQLLDSNTKIVYLSSFAANRNVEKIFSEANIKIIRQNIYIPNSILNANKIKEMMYKLNPNSIVFLSAESVRSFMNSCSEELLNKVKNMNFFAIGRQTAFALEEYIDKDILIPDYPDITMMSKMIYDCAENYQGN